MQKAQDSKTEAWPGMVWPQASWFQNPFVPASPENPAVTAKPGTPGASIENMMQGILQDGNPWLKACAQTNAEMLGLISRRSEATAALMTQVSQCRAPQDLAGLQTQFWQAAIQQNIDAAKRIASAWGTVMPIASSLPANGGATAPAASAEAPQRDRITFPDAKDAAVAAPRPNADRRSAA
jgi:Phasin protein